MVKINLSDNAKGPSTPVELGDAVRVIASHSNSRPGMFHFTMKLSEPVVFKRLGSEPVEEICTCPGFMNHRKCWHIAYLSGEGDELDES